MGDDLEVENRSRVSGRSPSYPSLSLGRALERTKVLWSSERQHATPIEAAVRRWGYTNFSGKASLTVAALIKYGLLANEGSKSERRVRVTDLAVRILNHPDPDERRLAIRQAALTPDIHSEMWEKYGSALPSDESLHWELTRERRFTETGASEFMREYRETLAFSGLDGEVRQVDDSQGVSPFEEESVGPETRRPTAVSAVPLSGSGTLNAGGERTIPIPLPGGGAVTLSGPFPIEDRHWEYVMAVLDAMKPGLVTESLIS